jgi:predicted  nucleic acid-binding Zn-ribbon protein
MNNYDFDYTSNDDRITELEARIDYLERENVSLTNELYELHNRIDAIEVCNDINTLKQFTLEK